MTLKSLTGKLFQIEEKLSEFSRARGLAFMRIAIGANALFFLYLQRVGQARFIWGHDGAQPWPLFHAYMIANSTFSLYSLAKTDASAAALFGVGALVTIAFTLGICTRLTTVLFYLFTWSLYQRDALLLTGGDNLLYLIAFFMIFADCGRVCSIDATIGLRRWRNSKYLSLIHNFAVTAIMIQICLLYFTSAFYKMQGFVWQDGTAIYYIMNVGEFRLDPWLSHVYNNASLVTMLTYGTFVFQSAFPFAVFNKTLKWIVLPVALSFHLAIAYCMDLVSFSLVMLGAELIFFSDGEYVQIGAIASGMWRRIRESRFSLVPPAPLGSVASQAANELDR